MNLDRSDGIKVGGVVHYTRDRLPTDAPTDPNDFPATIVLVYPNGVAKLHRDKTYKDHVTYVSKRRRQRVTATLWTI